MFNQFLKLLIIIFESGGVHLIPLERKILIVHVFKIKFYFQIIKFADAQTNYLKIHSNLFNIKRKSVVFIMHYL